MFTPVFETVADREIACPLCGGTHLVANKHWWDEGRKVSEQEAVECAHWMAYYDHKAHTTEFALFEPRPTPAPNTVPPGHFAATWTTKRSKRTRKAAV